MSFERAREAFRKGEFHAAISLLSDALERDPGQVSGHLLLARAFLEGGQPSTAFQVCKSLLLHPEIRLRAPLPREEMDGLLIDVLLAWATAIEKADFPKDEMDPFGKAVVVYAEAYPGRRAADLKGLTEGLREGRYVTAMTADVIRGRP